jgi:putative intracellular protease/amidase
MLVLITPLERFHLLQALQAVTVSGLSEVLAMRALRRELGLAEIVAAAAASGGSVAAVAAGPQLFDVSDATRALLRGKLARALEGREIDVIAADALGSVLEELEGPGRAPGEAPPFDAAGEIERWKPRPPAQLGPDEIACPRCALAFVPDAAAVPELGARPPALPLAAAARPE